LGGSLWIFLEIVYIPYRVDKSGLIIAAFLELSEYCPRLFSILRIAIFSIVPSTWVLFFQARQQVYPREGYFLWILGMLLAMFPAQFSPSGPDISQASFRK
jgi:hypothetical protein